MITHLSKELLWALPRPEDRIREQLIDQYNRQFMAATNYRVRLDAMEKRDAEIAKRSEAAKAVLERLKREGK